jgi:putative glutamine amidotransferase
VATIGRVRPRIALTLSRPTPTALRSHQRYIDALEACGAEVVRVYPEDEIPVDVDGLLLSGGGDIAPDRYGETDDACELIDSDRDEVELRFAREALERDLPILGICRGFQVLNVAFGGKLVQDVPGHRPPATDREGVVHHHGVRARPGSRLGAALGDAAVTVNSRHHQAVTSETLAPGLAQTAQVDGLIEAFEAEGRKWVVGVQWHPERTAEVSSEAVGIFRAFVSAARR